MSGGGIWAFPILFNDDSDEKKYFFDNNDVRLIGVNYYQTDIKNNKRSIIAMGPNSILNGLCSLFK